MDSAPPKKQKPVSFIILICMVLLIVAGTGVFLIKSNVGSQKNSVASKPACAYDTSVCAFLEKLTTQNPSYQGPITVNIQITKPTTPTQNQQVTLQTDEKDNLHIVSSQNSKPNTEMVMIGDTVYMKNLTNGVWQEQTSIQTPMLSDFRNKALDQVKKTSKSTKYTYIATEPCGQYTCLKYEVSPAATGQGKEYIFFDNTDYLLRKVLNLGADDTSTEAAFSYTPLSITPPPLN